VSTPQDRADYPPGCWFRRDIGTSKDSFIFNTNAGSFTSFNTDSSQQDSLVCSLHRTFTVNGCSSKLTSNGPIGSLPSGSAVVGMDFMNIGQGDAYIKSGASPMRNYLIKAGRSASAMCGTWSGDIMSFHQ